MIPSFQRCFFFILLALMVFFKADISLGEGLQPKTTKLKVTLSPYLAYAPFFIAQEEGFFRDKGLQIEFIRMDEAATMMPALIQGDLHIVTGFIAPSFFNVIGRGGMVKIVSDRGYVGSTSCTYLTFMARRTLFQNGKLRSPAQLKDCKVAMLRTSSASGYYFEKILNKGGLSSHDVEFVNVPPSLRLEAFQKGTIDLSLEGEPWITRIVESGHGVIWMPADRVIPNFQIGVILYGPTLLEKDREAGQCFMVAYLKGVRQYHQGKTDRNLSIISKYLKMDRDLLKKVCWPPIHNEGKINVESVIDFQKWALKKGYLDKEVSPSQFWDPSFVDYANKVLREIAK